MALIVKTTGFEEFLDPSGGSWIKALILGAAGAGKTRSASFWPKPIFADCERGLMSVADRGVPYVDIHSSKDMDSLLEHLRLDGMKPALKRNYQTLIIDTFDSYQRVLIQERLRSERKESLSGWADWGFLDAKMSQLIEKMINLPMNIVVNLHVKDDTDQDGESQILVKKARLKGDIKDSIWQDFDLIGLMETSYVAEKGERVLKRQIRWHSEPRFPMLRDRSGKLPRFTDIDFTEEDFDRIHNAIVAGIDDLPESRKVDVVDQETEPDVPGPNEKGAPLDDPKLPAEKKAPAKKTAAKKAPAKKSTPPPEPVEKPVEKSEPEVTVESDPEPPEEPDEAAVEPEPEPEPSTDVESKSDTTAQALITNKLGGQVVEDEKSAGQLTTKAEPAEPPAERKAGTLCGSQPASMQKFTAIPGCGRPMSKENATKHQFALLRTKTYVCDDCFDHWKNEQQAS